MKRLILPALALGLLLALNGAIAGERYHPRHEERPRIGLILRLGGPVLHPQRYDDLGYRHRYHRGKQHRGWRHGQRRKGWHPGYWPYPNRAHRPEWRQRQQRWSGHGEHYRERSRGLRPGPGHPKHDRERTRELRPGPGHPRRPAHRRHGRH